MRLFTFLTTLLALTGCLATTPPVPAPDTFIPNCGQDRFRGLVGQDAGTLREVDLPHATRVVKPGITLTQDYRPDRLNISVDEDGIIDRVWCS
ncbi:Peptidase inhibitor I78 family protein [Aliiroseovarius sediminilitoris]|uniref:Peptidase inhibitor I78 family protein n=1 Tax=Aliiroseovarius sediminilitoris TaxID=1173584 RepID=A0A1I0QWA7_9RHOB|nr:I78 family peptidase inhibitor [Aliiroseovarius sediminilitoris]SEW31287.1 Peptidase inhibitor I78 family protein [Aliiroseovarius sediminilitoris]